jgi:hypothetical protein
MCDNALVIAYAASQKSISGDVIQEVADDLRLPQETNDAQRKKSHKYATAGRGAIEDPRGAPDGGHQPNKKSLFAAGVPTALVISGFLALVFIVISGSFFSTLWRTGELFRSDAGKSLTVTSLAPKTLPERAVAENIVREQVNREFEVTLKTTASLFNTVLLFTK